MTQYRHPAECDAERLRAMLRAAQAGSSADHAAALTIAAARAKRLAGPVAQADGAVQQAVRLVHCLRHTYDPNRCPIRWMDAVIVAALQKVVPPSGAD
jgi:hypothetical protein